MSQAIGSRIVDLTDVLDQFEAQEGEVQHIIGKTGQGKTYEATRRAGNYLYSGYVVYTTWRLNLPDYYDEREHFWPVLRNLILGRTDFFRFNFKENWKYIDLDLYTDPVTKVFDTKKFSEFLATLTDCIVFLDEGQDTFDSHDRTTKAARQSITRTRHMHKTLIIISQRAQAVDVNARANVTYFYKCEKSKFLFWTKFKVYRTDEIDEGNNYPIWVRHDSTGRVTWKAHLWHSGSPKKWVYDMYDSWYLRQQMVKSQTLELEAYKLRPGERFRALYNVIFRRRGQVAKDTV